MEVQVLSSTLGFILNKKHGELAHLVEHLLCKQEVRGSSPLDSIVQEDKKSDVSDGVSITPISITWGCQVSTGHKGLIC